MLVVEWRSSAGQGCRWFHVSNKALAESHVKHLQSLYPLFAVTLRKV